LGQPPTLAKLNADLSREKGATKPSASTHSKCVASPSMNMVNNQSIICPSAMFITHDIWAINNILDLGGFTCKFQLYNH
jgi:hypothetical protein